MNIGMLIEDLYCNGLAGRALTAQEREEMIEYGLHFEECRATRVELAAMTDKDLIQSVYYAMAEYASGQV